VVSDIVHKIFVVSDIECEVNCVQPWLKVIISFKRVKIFVNVKQYIDLGPQKKLQN
jgi:hypothetical protein